MTYLQKNYFNTKKHKVRDYAYDSKFEAEYALVLEEQKKKGEIKSWKPQQTLDLVVNGYKVCTYRIDFVVEHLDGIIEYIEMKGWATPVWKLKWKLFEALYSDKPDKKLTVIFQGKTWKPRLPKVR